MDTLSQLIDINPDVELPKEKPGQEFRYNFLEDLPPIEVEEIIVEGVEIKPDIPQGCQPKTSIAT